MWSDFLNLHLHNKAQTPAHYGHKHLEFAALRIFGSYKRTEKAKYGVRIKNSNMTTWPEHLLTHGMTSY